MTHYVEKRFTIDPGTYHRRRNILAVCGFASKDPMDITDVVVLVNCPKCREHVRRASFPGAK